MNDGLGVQLNEYELSGRHFFANDRSPTIPASLAPYVADILGLESARRMRSAHIDGPETDDIIPPIGTSAIPVTQPRPKSADTQSKTAGRTDFITGGLSSSAIEPTDLWSSQGYNYGALSRIVQGQTYPTPNGSLPPIGSSIAIPVDGLAKVTDLAAFFSQYRVQNPVTYQLTTTTPILEATIDSEYATAMSNLPGTINPGAVYYYSIGSQGVASSYDAWEEIEEADNARILSSSTGSPEYEIGDGLFGVTLDDYYTNAQTMVAAGYTLVMASGDSGSANDGTGAIYPASDPYFIGVGGTVLNMTPSVGTFESETVWPGPAILNQNSGAAGGGCSGYFEPPPWQQPYVNNTTLPWNYCLSGASYRKSIPDLSLNAGATQVIIENGTPTGATGTSVSAPAVAGFFALENAYLQAIAVANGTCPAGGTEPCNVLGTPGPAIWAAGAVSMIPRPAFYDVTSGTIAPTPPGCVANGSNRCTNGYKAITGYDKASGWGSFNALQLAWAINSYVYADRGFPKITFSAQAPSGSSATEYPYSTTVPVIEVTITTSSSVGIAGYTWDWDTEPGDVNFEATPNTTTGAGNSYYTGPLNSGSSFRVVQPAGCHSLFVRAWDNAGYSTPAQAGYFCYEDCSGGGDPSSTICETSSGYECCANGYQCATSADGTVAGSLPQCEPAADVCGSTYCSSVEGYTCLAGGVCCDNDYVCDGACATCAGFVGNCGGPSGSCGIQCAPACPNGYYCSENHDCINEMTNPICGVHSPPPCVQP